MTTDFVENLKFFPAGVPVVAGNVPSKLDEFASLHSLNVKNFGAIGDGTADDRAAIQSCFDAAFGSAVSPHAAANSALNRPVYFPPGTYKLLSGALTLTQVKGGLIYGLSDANVLIRNDSGPCLVVTGFEDSRIESMSFQCNSYSNTAHVGLDLNCSSATPVGLKNNKFRKVSATLCNVGIRLGEGGIEGYGNLFEMCHPTNNFYGLKIKAAGGANTFISCNPFDNNGGAPVGTPLPDPPPPPNVFGYAIWFDGTGSAVMLNGGSSGFQNDIKMTSTGTLTILGGRSEVRGNYVEAAAGTTLIIGAIYHFGGSATSTFNQALKMSGTAVVVADGITIDAPTGTITGTSGTVLYLRGGSKWLPAIDTTVLASFSGQMRQFEIDRVLPFARRPANPMEGCEFNVSDAVLTGGPPPTWGQPVTTGGSTGRALLRWNGTAWTLVG